MEDEDFERLVNQFKEESTPSSLYDVLQQAYDLGYKEGRGKWQRKGYWQGRSVEKNAANRQY